MGFTRTVNFGTDYGDWFLKGIIFYSDCLVDVCVVGFSCFDLNWYCRLIGMVSITFVRVICVDVVRCLGVGFARWWFWFCSFLLNLICTDAV